MLRFCRSENVRYGGRFRDEFIIPYESSRLWCNAVAHTSKQITRAAKKSQEVMIPVAHCTCTNTNMHNTRNSARTIHLPKNVKY